MNTEPKAAPPPPWMAHLDLSVATSRCFVICTKIRWKVALLRCCTPPSQPTTPSSSTSFSRTDPRSHRLRELVRESGGFHVVRYLCHNARHEIADGLLNEFATENACMSMDTLCRQSTKGCPFEVQVVAQARSHLEIVKMLSHYITEDITQCLRAAHATGATKMSKSNGVGLINRT